MKKIALALITTIFLAGCVDGGQKQQMGTLVGAGLGALAGSQIGHGKGQLAAVAIGTLVGAGIGNSVGKSLDRADRLAMQNAQYQALEKNASGSGEVWHNPDSGNSGSLTPRRTFQNDDGQYCREFTQTITVGGDSREGYGTACRRPDGSWEIMNG